MRVPLLGDEIERGIPAFIRQTQAAQAQLTDAAAQSNAMKRLQRQFILLTAALLAAAAIFVSMRAALHFEESLTTQAARRRANDRPLGHRSHPEGARLHDVPFDKLVDSEQYLEAVKLDNPGVDIYYHRRQRWTACATAPI